MNAVNEQMYASKDYKRSRWAYKLECTFEYFVTLLVADAFLATLLSSLGMSDSMVGIISSIASLAFLFQLFSVLVAQRIRNTKRFVIIFHTLSQLFFMSLYFIPFLPFAEKYKHILVFACVLLAYFGNYFVTSIIFKWGNSFVDPHKRASYSAGKEMISLASGMVMTIILGWIMDRFEAMENLNGGFIFCAVGILIFSVCDFVCLLLIKNEIKPKEIVSASESKNPSVEKRATLRMVLKNIMGNRNFRNVVLLTILWDVARYTTIGFLGIYRVGAEGLAFTVGAVQVINIIGNLGRFLLSKPFGRFSDKHSFAKGIEVALVLAALAFGVNMFTAPGPLRYLTIAYTLLYSINLAGLNQNLYNITYSYVDSEYFVQASAIKNSIGGICGFGASLAAGKLLEVIQANGNMLFGIPVHGQQVLSAISFVLLIIAVLFTRFVIGRQKVMIQ